MRILTAGESHGKCLVGIMEGFPANVPIDVAKINRDLARRQQGFGRGKRMEIEQDRIEILAGVRDGKTIGSPIAFQIANRDYANWQKRGYPQVTKPRPGHADLAGVLKYGFTDVRNVLERSSARETAVRVGAGGIAKQLLELFGIRVYSHVTAVGDVVVEEKITDTRILQQADESDVRCVNPTVAADMVERIKVAMAAGDSLGGVFEVHITGVPVGLGSHVHWDRKLDAKLAYALMSIQGIKGVEIGDGFETARRPGSAVHDEIFYSPGDGCYRKTNSAGGIEGGMSNGETIVVRCAMKPIPTLRKPLQTVDIQTNQPALASVERSDTCAVPAASIVGEMVAITVIAEEFLQVYGGDSLEEIKKRWSS